MLKQSILLNVTVSEILLITSFVCFLQILCATENAKNILNFISEEIERHREDFDPNNIRDFIDEYLASSLGGRCKKKPIHSKYRYIGHRTVST